MTPPMKITIVENPALENPENRWCEACGHEHGPLYLCPHYSDEVKTEVLAADAKYREALRHIVPKTKEEEFHLAIFKAFAGKDPAEPA